MPASERAPGGRRRRAGASRNRRGRRRSSRALAQLLDAPTRTRVCDAAAVAEQRERGARSAPAPAACRRPRAWCRRGSADRPSPAGRCGPAHRPHRRDRRRSSSTSVVLATKLRRRSSARLKARWRHREAALARPGQEVGDVGVEPEVVAADRPQAERRRSSPGAPARARSRRARARRALSSSASSSVRRELVDVEQRQRAADDLLGAAIGIAVERLQQPRHVERGERRDRDRDRAGAGQDIGHEIAARP